MLEHFHSRLHLVEEEFGKKFLEKQSDHELRPSGKRQHPVRYHWRKAKAFLEGLGPGQADLADVDLARIVQIADAIDATRSLPGYDSEIRDELLSHSNHQKYENTLYEMVTAADYVERRIGDVAFVARARHGGVRSPDLRISRGGEVIWGECTRRQPVGVSPLPKPLPPRIVDAIEKLSQVASPSLDVRIIIPGGDEGLIVSVIERTNAVVAPGKPGLYLSQELGSAVIVGEAQPAEQFIVPNGIMYLAPELPNATYSRYDLGEIVIGGSRPMVPPTIKSISVFALDSHSFKEVNSSFTQKRNRETSRRSPPRGRPAIIRFALER